MGAFGRTIKKKNTAAETETNNTGAFEKSLMRNLLPFTSADTKDEP